MAECLRLRPKEAQEILGCSKSYLRSLVRAGKISLFRESSRYVFFRRADVLRLCGIGDAPDHAEEPAQEPAEAPIPQIVDDGPRSGEKRRGRPRKRLEVR